MSIPKVSIGLPVYNGERYLRFALDSLLGQDFHDFEIVICDNASIDGTTELCRAYAAKDPRIRYFRNETNIGASPNYNRTFELARGQYFKWLAHDDRCHRSFLSRCVAMLDAAPPSVALVYPLCDVIGEFNEVLHRAPDCMINQAKHPYQRLAYVLRTVGWAYSLWGLIRSDHLRRTRLMAEGAQNDYVLLAELSLCGEFLEVPEVLFQLRFHPGNAWGTCSAPKDKAAWKENTKASRQSRQALLAWTDPKFAHKKLWLPFHEDLCFRYLKGVHHARLPVSAKLLCYGTVPAVCYWRRFRNFGGLWKRRLLKTFGHGRELAPIQD
jgi:glycosyltransferase involved in cell wall biosynthesis